MGTLFSYVLESNLPAGQQRFADLAKTMGEPDDRRSIERLAPCAITAIKRLLIDLDFPRKYSKSQIIPEAMGQAAKIAMGGRHDPGDSRKDYSMNASVNIRKAQ